MRHFLIYFALFLSVVECRAEVRRICSKSTYYCFSDENYIVLAHHDRSISYYCYNDKKWNSFNVDAIIGKSLVIANIAYILPENEKQIIKFDMTLKQKTYIDLHNYFKEDGDVTGHCLYPYDIVANANYIIILVNESNRVIIHDLSSLSWSIVTLKFYPTRIISHNNKFLLIDGLGERLYLTQKFIRIRCINLMKMLVAIL
jgi:hypothetical protein